jgi:hypothetical protein
MKNTPSITWVNHAGYVLSYNKVNILVDPWHTGGAFNNGWKLLVDTHFPKSLKDKINYIWISHEHPDHFSPKDIVNFPKKKNIKIIFQNTKDKRVVSFLKKKGFQIIELENYKKLKINKNFKITIVKNDQIDSLSIFEVDDKVIINTNDCVLTDQKLKIISKKLNIQSSDVLLTQFSYASWIGNKSDKDLRNKAAKEKLNQISSQIKYFKPKITIPFASYVYFSHHENKYMNDKITKLKDVKNVIYKNESEAIFLFPGSVYNIGSDNINKFDIDYKNYIKAFSGLHSKNYSKSESIEYLLLEKNSKEYLNKLYKKNNKIIMFFFYYLSKFSHLFFRKDFIGFSCVCIYLEDIKKIVEFDWKSGLRIVHSKVKEIDISISSDSLNYIFLHEWGIGSLMINGRGSYRNMYCKWKFNRIFSLGLINSTGDNLLSKIFKKIIFVTRLSFENHEPSFLKKIK